MKRINVELTSTSAMLHHRFATEEHGENSSKIKKKVYVPVEEAEKASYKNPDGTLFQPSEHILGVLIRSGVGFKYEGKKTYKEIIKAGIVVEPDNIPLLDNEGNVRTTWDEIDARPVVVQRARVVRWRPKFNEWKLRLQLIIINEDLISVAALKDIMEASGMLGIGDYRPRFGRFQVTQWQEE